MKSNGKAILCVLIATIFLIPLIGNSVLSEGRGSYTWYFNDYDENEAWETNPENMVDGNTSTFASTSTAGDVQLLNESTYEPTHENGTIIKVEIRAHGYYTGQQQPAIILRPVFGGTADGDDHYFYPPQGLFNANWSVWFDITVDRNAPFPWEWTDIRDLDCDVEARPDPAGPDGWTLYCSKVEIRVTYIT